MSGGNYFFPPPPPPPPSRPASEGAGGADRLRGRDGHRGRSRGRGQPSFHDFHTSQYRPGRVNYESASRPTTGNGYGHGLQQQNSRLPRGLPTGTNVNPAFSGNGVVPPNRPRQQVGDATSNFPPRTYAGHKRKLDALRPSPPHERKPKPDTAPSIPNFGSPIVPFTSTRITRPSSTTKTHAPATLGLIPTENGPPSDASDGEAGEDVDEEALYAELGAHLTFEHNGTVMSLKSAADLAAWKNERKRNWPTRARMAEREVERRRVGELRRRLLGWRSGTGGQWITDFTKVVSDNGALGAKQANGEIDGDSSGLGNGREEESTVDKVRRELAEQGEKLKAMRQRVAESQALLDQKNQQSSPADMDGASKPKLLVDYSDDDGNDENGKGVIEEAVVENVSNSASDSSAISSESSSEEDSGQDEPPEETSIKRPEIQQAGTSAPICKYFAASGHCRDGAVCQFRHDGISGGGKRERAKLPRPTTKPDGRRSDGRKGIYRRLLEQQQEEENRLALQVIKHLGKVGIFESDSTEL